MMSIEAALPALPHTQAIKCSQKAERNLKSPVYYIVDILETLF